MECDDLSSLSFGGPRASVKLHGLCLDSGSRVVTISQYHNVTMSQYHNVEDAKELIMRTIRVDDDVWQALQKKAVAFEDTPNTVLRRVLRVDGKKRRKSRRHRAAPGKKTPQHVYRKPLLRVLYEMGGSGNVADVLERVERILARQLNEVDRGRLAHGEPRWRNTAQWERNVMVQDGLLKKKSPRGVWELTAKGIAAVEDGVD